MNYEELYKRYKKQKLKTQKKDFVENLLMRKFNAIEIPLYSIHPEDYGNDDEIDETKIYKLFTITNPETLKKIFTKDEKFMHTDDRKDNIVYNIKDEELIYNTLIDEHNKGYRLSIVLESDDNIHVSNFKVYGITEYLNTYLIALIGLKEMILGDLNDNDFIYYLECLEKHSFI